jgi:hypothetical protein
MKSKIREISGKISDLDSMFLSELNQSLKSSIEDFLGISIE